VYLLIPAAGVGRRMGSDRNKLLLTLLDQPLLAWTLKAASQSQTITWVGIIGQTIDQAEIEAIVTDLALPIPVTWIEGGATRQESVYNGLQALPTEANQVLIHDGARCLATPDLFDRCSEALETCDGLIAAVPVKDTIKVVNQEGWIESTPDRRQLWAAQTPQGFAVPVIKACHEQGRQAGAEVTDDAALFEYFRHPVKIVEGEETNLKITTPVDLTIAEFILRQRYDL
jgi:2-C-methyl-D-erythritol 4-phosphate cytidylyltransferase